MKKLLIGILVLFSSCTVQKINKSLTKSGILNQGHMGFMLLDPEKDKVLVDINSDKYFIPASNTKLFTFYTSYSVLGDNLVNGLNYIEKGDSLLFWGTGDPGLLHPDLQNEVALEFLKSSNKNLYLVDNFDQVDAFGPGWSWDWYNYYYATERSALPIFGNVVRIQQDSTEQTFRVIPERFKPDLTGTKTKEWNGYRFRRDRFDNKFSYQTADRVEVKEFEQDIPFVTSSEFTAKLLEEKTGKEITIIQNKEMGELDPQKLQTTPADSIYAQMMKISDNFLAEQLMLLVSDQLTNQLSTSDAIAYAKESLLADLPDEPLWVDGSGLSAKNMFTPRSIIALLGKIRAEVPLEKIKAYFPAGGES